MCAYAQSPLPRGSLRLRASRCWRGKHSAYGRKPRLHARRRCGRVRYSWSAGQADQAEAEVGDHEEEAPGEPGAEHQQPEGPLDAVVGGAAAAPAQAGVRTAGWLGPATARSGWNGWVAARMDQAPRSPQASTAERLYRAIHAHKPDLPVRLSTSGLLLGPGDGGRRLDHQLGFRQTCATPAAHEQVLQVVQVGIGARHQHQCQQR
jgi:hypothetical protein